MLVLRISERGVSPAQDMVATIPPQYGRVASFAVLQRAAGSHRTIRDQVLRVHFPVGNEKPPRMTPRRFKNACPSLQPCSLVIMHTGPSLGGEGRVTTMANNAILVRGGAALPLSAALVATACLAAVFERRSKVGGTIGAPLLCFGIFCVLRCVARRTYASVPHM